MDDRELDAKLRQGKREAEEFFSRLFITPLPESGVPPGKGAGSPESVFPQGCGRSFDYFFWPIPFCPWGEGQNKLIWVFRLPSKR